MSDASGTIEQIANQEYKWGFVTDIESDAIPRGLNEDVVRLISAKKTEPAWLLEWRLKAFRHWQTLTEPAWARDWSPQSETVPTRLAGLLHVANPTGGSPAASIVYEMACRLHRGNS